MAKSAHAPVRGAGHASGGAPVPGLPNTGGGGRALGAGGLALPVALVAERA